MIKIIDKHNCVGCRACEQICPVHCIKMSVDREGFKYPLVDQSICVNCHLCERVCPMLAHLGCNKPIKTLACKSTDINVQRASSSGGAFTVLASEILERGGIVFGAIFDNNFNVIHSSTTIIEELDAFRRSKYVQSDTRNVYSLIKSLLVNNREVLFCGTPCQVKGLKLFLQNEYDKLWSVDFICHGVPSPKVWENYLAALIKEQGNGWSISDVNFRSKAFGGWHRFALEFSLYNADKSKRIIAKAPGQDPYYQLFSQNISLRPSCYKCPAKGFTSGSDFTLGDFWGIQNCLPKYDDHNGVSLLMANSKKAIDLLGKVNLDFVEVDNTTALRSNPSVWHSVLEPKQRENFFNTDSFTMSRLNKFSGLDFYGRLRRRIIEIVLSILKRRL